MMKATQNRVTWVIEPSVFPQRYETFRSAILAEGHQLVIWDDDWWSTGDWPTFPETPVVFHGSLGNAARIANELPWKPGAFCATEAFACSAWYPSATKWLLQRKWVRSTVAEFAANPRKVVAELGNSERVFVRPDSPLKPFSGRVLDVGKIDLRALDHGFYYDDEHLPVIVAQARTIDREWRYFVVRQLVVAGSGYAADGRTPLVGDPNGAPWKFAAEIVANLPPPDVAYVLDVCEANGEFHLVELNPFSGADPYAADPTQIVRAISDVLVHNE